MLRVIWLLETLIFNIEKYFVRFCWVLFTFSMIPFIPFGICPIFMPLVLGISLLFIKLNIFYQICITLSPRVAYTYNQCLYLKWTKAILDFILFYKYKYFNKYDVLVFINILHLVLYHFNAVFPSIPLFIWTNIKTVEVLEVDGDVYYVLHVRFSMGELSKRKSKPAHTARIKKQVHVVTSKMQKNIYL